MPPKYHYIHIITLTNGTQIRWKSRERKTSQEIEEMKQLLNTVKQRIDFKRACLESIQEDEEFLNCSLPIIVTEPQDLPPVQGGGS